MPEHDLVIRGGTIIDGSGGEPFKGDLSISGKLITGVGEVEGKGQEEIDATGHIVTPGFVDLHTHYDGQVTWEQRLSPSSDHGVTTVIMGNCAVGLAPCRPEQRELLIQVTGGVEDIPEAVMTEGLPWNWETFPEYLDALSQRECDIDFAAQLAHAPLRVYVMGQRGADREPAKTEDLAQMSALVTEALDAGAVGVSTSRTFVHRSTTGALAPVETAGADEVMALARGMRTAGKGVFEGIADFADVSVGGSADFDLFKQVSVVSGRPVSFTVLQSLRQPTGWTFLLDLIDKANAEGVSIRGQVAPRAVGIGFGLDLSFNFFSFHPSYQAIAELPLAERVAAMRDPAFKTKLLSETPGGPNPVMLWMTGLYADCFPLDATPNYEPKPERRVDVIARARGQTALEAAYDLLLEDEGRSILYLPITNFGDGTLSASRTMMANPNTMIALGDGGAHYGMICDASYPTFALTHWVRDRKDDAFSLPWMIHALTRRPAEWVGFLDRGLLRAGYKADVNVIDYERLKLHRPVIKHDLPAGGRRMVQPADGYRATIVSGQITQSRGRPTGRYPGRLVRGAQPAPA